MLVSSIWALHSPFTCHSGQLCGCFFWQTVISGCSWRLALCAKAAEDERELESLSAKSEVLFSPLLSGVYTNFELHAASRQASFLLSTLVAVMYFATALFLDTDSAHLV